MTRKWSVQLCAVAMVGAIEALAHPVTVLLFLVSAGSTLILPLFQFQRFTEDGRLARDCGLATAFLFGLFLVAGSAGRLYKSLHDGTAAATLTKPLSRGLWWWGNAVGLAVALGIYLLMQGGVTLLAEASSPQYHAQGTYGEIVPKVFALLLIPVGALILGAGLNRFRGARFAFATNFLMVVLTGVGVCCFEGVHWGTLTALVAIGMALLQGLTFALMCAVVLPPGITLGGTLAAMAVHLLFLNGAAYLPLDAVAKGGALSLETLCYLTPQTLVACCLFGWVGTKLLEQRQLS